MSVSSTLLLPALWFFQMARGVFLSGGETGWALQRLSPQDADLQVRLYGPTTEVFK